MKKTNKKGFTIVELVIVIAVIAVLAAVLIPTFSGIIEKANLSNDTSLVASINTAIAVEQVVSGDPNDAIEIAKIIKEYGMKLETKSKGNYLWYDIEKGKVILAGLDENGIVLNDAGANARSTKGSFKASASSPESFVEGYLFITEESKDGLADAIYALHNPKGDNEEELKECLQEALADIQDHGNNKLYTVLNDFMSTTAVMTENGMAFCGATNNSVNRIIVSAEMKKVTPESLNRLSSYNNIIVVDFHSDVAEITPEAVDIIANENKIFYVYNNEKIEAIDKANDGDIAKLISKPDRHKFIKTFVLDYYEEIVDADGNKTFELLAEEAKKIEFVPESYTLPYAFPYLFHNNGNQLYDFIAYSLYTDGANPIGVNLANGYTLTEAEQYLLTANDGVLKVNAFFKKANTDFKVNGVAYSSAGVTQMLANNALLPNGTTTIAVFSTTATLDASLIVGEKPDNLTIPSGVELLLPIGADASKIGLSEENGLKSGTYKASNYAAGAAYDKATMDGKTKLTIKGNVTLVNEGSIYVDAQLYYGGTAVQCFITNNCGVLVLDEGSKIISSGSITAYGVIRGEGTIDATAGTVTEIMTIHDWYGGTNATNAVSKNVTPFNNWKIEHIRAKMDVHDAAVYKAFTGVHFGAVKVFGLTISPEKTEFAEFILTSNTISDAKDKNPLFFMSEGAIIERSVSSTGNAKFTIRGNVSDVEKKLVLEDVALTVDADIDFTEMALPLSHFDVCVAPGAKLTISNNLYKVLPGSNITVEGAIKDEEGNVVEEGGILTISTKVAIYDSFTLVNKTNPSVSLPHTYPDLGEATLVVNGTLNFESGASFTGNITTTEEGAKINVHADVSNGGKLPFPEGYYISDKWYYAHDPETDTTPVLEDVAIDKLVSGTTYTSSASSVGDDVHYSWD